MSVISVPELGYCGGLLLVNTLGRPVEFHCTAPVPENKTQRILYGKTYESFLFCDQIGRALIDKAKQKAAVLAVDQAELLGMRNSLDRPLLLVQPKSDLEDLDNGVEFDGSIDCGEISVRCITSSPEQWKFVKDYCRLLSDSIPLNEPFERIRMAVDEAQSVIR